jgi:hypothetical protein
MFERFSYKLTGFTAAAWLVLMARMPKVDAVTAFSIVLILAGTAGFEAVLNRYAPPRGPGLPR